MKVARTYGIDDHRVEEFPDPVPGPGDAVLRVLSCGLCGSDALDWYVAGKAPTVLGHEPVGEVVAVGREVAAFSPGDRVFAHHHVPCGSCRECRRGLDTNCVLFRRTALDPGGFAELVRVPAENLVADTHIVPTGLPDDDATLLEPLACAVRALHRGRIREGDAVHVVGLGVMGILLVEAARAMGAGTITGSDPIRARRALAAGRGADLVIDPSAEDAAASVRRATGGRGADLVVVGPPSAPAMGQGLEAAGPGGAVVLFSPLPPGERVAVEAHDLYFGERTITASYSCGPRDTREAIAMVAEGAVRLDGLVSHRFGLDGLAEAVRLSRGKGLALKCVIVPHKIG